MNELLIKNIISEILFNSRITESIEDSDIVNYVYGELKEALLYGEPVSVPELRQLLRKKILNFQFIKLDGEVRDAKGTTMMKYVPQTQHPKGIRPSSTKVATFYDLKKKDWRSVSQKSKEIVLKKDEDTGKPIIMVKDKDNDQDIAIKDVDKTSTQTDTGVNVTNVKPIKAIDELIDYVFVNPVTGASIYKTISAKDAVKELKRMGPNWEIYYKEEYEDGKLSQGPSDEGDYLKVNDVRNYLNRNNENVIITITRQDDNGDIYAQTVNGATFKVPNDKIQNIGAIIDEKDLEDKTTVVVDDIINKEEDLDNVEANEI